MSVLVLPHSEKNGVVVSFSQDNSVFKEHNEGLS